MLTLQLLTNYSVFTLSPLSILNKTARVILWKCMLELIITPAQVSHTNVLHVVIYSQVFSVFFQISPPTSPLASFLFFKYYQAWFQPRSVIMHLPLLGMFFLKIFTWLASLPASGTSCLLISEAFSLTTQLKISLSLGTLLPFLIFFHNSNHHAGFPGDSVVKNPPANAGDMGLISGSGRSPGEGHGNPL